ncbi:MAG: GNAT family N-acetyltransferase, partial [Pyramidobacter sp.]|nr:GNAT family N-acetyltransferase [Pyramidobacter sp.]
EKPEEFYAPHLHFAYYDKDRLVGFSFATVSDQAVFLIYLTVEPDLRSKGYGSMILKQIAEVGSDLRFFGRYGGCSMVVEDIAVAGT